MMTLIAGSYERFIWGFSLRPSASETLTLAPLFSYPSHAAPIKCAASLFPLAATGSADDSIRLYDLSLSSELGSLLDHAAPVTSLSFFSSPLAPSIARNLVSASADGNICIYDAGNRFVHLKTVPVHRKGVADLAVHPSGRLALTVGRDAGIGMVNLVRGRRSFLGKLDREAEIVRYGDGGAERFFLVRDERISVHDSEDARVLAEMDGGRRVLSAAAGESGLLFTGGEDRNVTAWDTTSGKVAYCIDGAHSARVKGLVVFKKKSDDQTCEAPNVLASAASDGVIRVWDLRMITKEKPNPLAEANTKSRLTCLAGSSSK
ncbi:putative p21-activated protein kinase-interacting protein 1-like isoform X1 [Iris pallida]|uniref:P21-activated protein kinase-interacting protein 1-like isoform X1 n=1 Tax=Iris pallida TaxID=29817 RepID=A0AAX6IM77_IRIPA|nr:putative p21-activated protein kinase-interacting protein 1-like isoform X1 [Iris pallida]